MAVAAAVALGVGTGPAWALPGTTFNAADGNLVIDGNETDWKSFAGAINCVAPFAGCTVDKPSGSGDDAFGGGAKDDKTSVDVVSGSVPNNKSDLLRGYVASEAVGLNSVLFLAWVRKNTLGTANFSIELNQIAQTDPPAAGSSYTIERSPGDLLVLYDFSSGGKADKVQLRLSRWVVSGNPKQVCQANNTVPCWGKAQLLDGQVAEASINKAVATDSLFPEPDGGTELKELTFGEAAIDLTALGILTPCEGFGSAMFRSRSSDSFNAELKDFIIPAKVDIQLPVDVTNWASDGEAMTARVFDSDLANPAKDLGPKASSSKVGPGTPDEDSDSLKSIDLPMPEPDDEDQTGDVVHIGLLAASAKSVVDEAGAITTQNSAATAAEVDILDGTVTADAVKSLAMTEARVNGATPTTGFSGIKNLKIDVDGNPGTPPAPISNNVAPNTKIGLSPTAFGPGSYVEIRREELTTNFPEPGTPLGSEVEFHANVVEITGLHVHITDRTPDPPFPLPGDDGDKTLDVVISKATAHSKSDGILCKAVQAVEGEATVLRGNVGDLANASVGHVAIPEGGGASHQEFDGFTLGDEEPKLVDFGFWQSHSEGSWDDDESNANSFAHVANLCVDLTAEPPPLEKVCEISADAIESAVSSTATGASRTSTGSTSFVNLKILGQEVNPQPGLLEEIPGVGLVAVNERTCDVGTLSGDTCTTSDGTKTAMTVRALHVVVTNPLPANELGLGLGSELVIAEAHSGATFVALP